MSTFLMDPLYQRANKTLCSHCRKSKNGKKKLSILNRTVKLRPLDYYLVWESFGVSMKSSDFWGLTAIKEIYRGENLVRSPDIVMQRKPGKYFHYNKWLSKSNNLHSKSCLEIILCFQILHQLKQKYNICVKDWKEFYSDFLPIIVSTFPCCPDFIKKFSMCQTTTQIKRHLSRFDRRSRDPSANETEDSQVNELIRLCKERSLPQTEPKTNIYYVSKFSNKLDSLSIENTDCLFKWIQSSNMEDSPLNLQSLPLQKQKSLAKKYYGTNGNLKSLTDSTSVSKYGVRSLNKDLKTQRKTLQLVCLSTEDQESEAGSQIVIKRMRRHPLSKKPTLGLQKLLENH